MKTKKRIVSQMTTIPTFLMTLLIYNILIKNVTIFLNINKKTYNTLGS